MKPATNDERVVIRELDLDDVAAVTALLDDGYQPYRVHFPPEMWDAYWHEITDIESRRSMADVLVAAIGSDVVGTVTFYSRAQLDGHGWPDAVASFRLLTVARSAAGRGVGRLLVRECIERAVAAGAGVLGLHTAPFMTAAIRLYETVGFVRAPEHDFQAHQIYGGSESATAIPGLAYVLPLHPPPARNLLGDASPRAVR